LPAAAWYFSIHPEGTRFFVFALAERKNRVPSGRTIIKIKYRSAACPEAPLSLSKGLPKGRLNSIWDATA
jgi:hypothetical protein